MLTNLERWRYYFKDIPSTDSYIDIGFYYLISTALQRRIWQSSSSWSIYPNLYIVLVGPPATGKGLVLGEITKMLKFHKWQKEYPIRANELPEILTNKDKQLELLNYYTKTLLNGDTSNTAIIGGENPHEDGESDLLYPMAPSSCTFEKLVQLHGRSMRAIRIKQINAKTGQEQVVPYMHRSLAFCLEELSSLFHGDSKRIGDYFLTAFDCKDYSYETKHQGSDFVRKPCLNFIGGTVPSFIENNFDETVLTGGLASRMLFVYEEKPRFEKFRFPTPSEDQLRAKAEILIHLHKLAFVYGETSYTNRALELMENYFEKVLPRKRINNSPRLDGYYARKKINTEKLAMAIHFSDSYNDMVINERDCELALEYLAHIEPNMHKALQVRANYKPLSKGGASTKVLRLIERANEEGMVYQMIWTMLMDELPDKKFLDEAIEHLTISGRIRVSVEQWTNPITNQQQEVRKYYYVKGSGNKGEYAI